MEKPESEFVLPPKPECGDDLMPEDMPDAMVAWELECNAITISKLQKANAELQKKLGQSQGRHDASCRELLGNIDKLEKDKTELQRKAHALMMNQHDSHCNCDRRKYRRYEEGSGCSCGNPRDRDKLAEQAETIRKQGEALKKHKPKSDKCD